MIFNLDNDFDKVRYKEQVNKFYEGGGVVELTKKRANRTLSQNSYLHLLLSFFASEYGCSTDEAKLDFFKRECNKELFERATTNKKGIEVTYLRSSSILNTSEMALAITRFRNWSASVAGIYLPAANEHQCIVYAQQTIETNKEFL